MKSYDPHFKENQRKKDLEYYESINQYFSDSTGTNLDKLRNFAKYVPVGEINKFLAKEKLFNQILNVHGSIVECGVFHGGGVMTWAALSAIYEPINHNRKIYGFDTFAGFPSVDKKNDNKNFETASVGGLYADSYEDITKAEELYDMYRPLGHIKKINLIKGDVKDTFPKFIDENKHLIVSLLYLDFDLYEPTKLAIEHFYKRMPKGAIIAFDELNIKEWHGETLALLDTIGIENIELKRFVHYPQISYAIKQ